MSLKYEPASEPWQVRDEDMTEQKYVLLLFESCSGVAVVCA